MEVLLASVDERECNVTAYCTIQDEPIGQLSFVDVGYTLLLNLIVFLSLLVVFEKMRHKRSVYYSRSIWYVPDQLFAISHRGGSCHAPGRAWPG
jgi:hypothetical protein